MDVTDLTKTLVKYTTTFPEIAGGTDVEALLEDTRLTISWTNVEGNGQVAFPVASLPMISDLIANLSEQSHVLAILEAAPEVNP